MPNSVLKVWPTELLSPDLPEGNYRVEGLTSLFFIGDHKEKEGLKEIQISSYNFSLSLPGKLLYGLNFEKLKNFCEKWSQHAVRTNIWKNVEHLAEHMAKVYKKAPDSDWIQYGAELFDQAVSETVRGEDFGPGFLRYIKEVYGDSHYIELKKPFLHTKHTMKDQLAFKAAYGRFMYPEESLNAPKTIQLFKESTNIVVGSFFSVPGTEQKILVCKDEVNLLALVASSFGDRYWSTLNCHKPLKNTFFSSMSCQIGFKMS